MKDLNAEDVRVFVNKVERAAERAGVIPTSEDLEAIAHVLDGMSPLAKVVMLCLALQQDQSLPGLSQKDTPATMELLLSGMEKHDPPPAPPFLSEAQVDDFSDRVARLPSAYLLWLLGCACDFHYREMHGCNQQILH